MQAPSGSAILAALERKGYLVFRNPVGYDLNLVGIRSASTTANRFDDWMTVTYLSDGSWLSYAFPCTTDPGTYYRLNPANVNGTAVLKPGQYRGVYQLGVHRGEYRALVQVGAVTVWRDANRDDVLDTRGQPEETGLFGINIHRASPSGPSVQVDRWSAGCQVLQDPTHFAFLLALAERGLVVHGPRLTYTLIEEADLPA